MTTEQIKDENLETQYTKVPFSIEEMKSYFMNKNKFFIINYKKSELKGNLFLSYVGNLEIPFEIDYTDATKEEKFELLGEFLKSRNIVKSNSLALTIAEILLHSRGIKNFTLIKNPILSADEIEEFIARKTELIDKWNTFLLSTNVYMLTTVSALDEAYNFKEQFQVITDANFVGHNVVQLFSVPSFMEAFLSVPADREIFYFKHQFEDYIYKGKNLFTYFNCPENTPYIIFQSLLSGDISLEDLTFMKGEG